jgi:hypothetical protein
MIKRFVRSAFGNAVLSRDWGGLLGGVTRDRRANGCNLSSLHHARACSGSVRHCEAEGACKRNVVNLISGDKENIESYCELADLNDQIDEAKHEQDMEKAVELSQKSMSWGVTWSSICRTG